MIKNLEIRNFKSIKHLKLDCKKVNVFIGKPNTGKSNLLESVGIFSTPYDNLKSFVRFEDMTNLSYDEDLSEGIQINADNVYCKINFENGKFVGAIGEKRSEDEERKFFVFEYDYSGTGSSSTSRPNLPFKFYRFSIMDKFAKQEFSFLLPPKGENLLSILLTNKALRKLASDIFSEYGLRVVLKPQEGKIEVQKEIEDVIISYPYSLEFS